MLSCYGFHSQTIVHALILLERFLLLYLAWNHGDAYAMSQVRVWCFSRVQCFFFIYFIFYSKKKKLNFILHDGFCLLYVFEFLMKMDVIISVVKVVVVFL